MPRAKPTYATESDLRDIYPNIDKYDTKKPIYGWETTGTPNFYKSYNTGLINVLFFDGIEGTAVTDDPNANYEFRYSPSNDSVEVFINTGSPADMLIESGEDWESHKTDLLYKASRFFDSYVDAVLPAQMSKNDEGEFPYLVVRTTAQICAYFLISAHDPENEDAIKIKEEYEEILEKLIAGQIKLDFEKSADSSKGIIRELSASGTLKPVDLRGSYRGGIYDKIRIQITTAGVIGTARYSVWTYGNDKLGINKGNLAVDNEIITGEYQTIGGGLRVRFGASTPTGTSGSTDDLMSASATLHDVYEVEVWGVGEELDDARGIKSAMLTRS